MATPIQSTDLEVKAPPTNQPKFPGLVVGRNIHYMNGRGNCCSATISKVRNRNEGLIDTTVFGGIFARSDSHPEAAVVVNNVKPGKITGQWHYMRECENYDQ